MGADRSVHVTTDMRLDKRAPALAGKYVQIRGVVPPLFAVVILELSAADIRPGDERALATPPPPVIHTNI